jgi:hypothetical protein
VDKLKVGNKYDIECSRGTGIVRILNKLEDSCGPLVDCLVLSGKFTIDYPSEFKERVKGSKLCLRPENVKWLAN